MEQDDRLKKELGVGRQSRAREDRSVTENREVTEADRLEMFRKQLFNDALPDLPNIPGYHVCWLTTTNSRDPIQRRIRLGYEPVKPEEVPGFEYATIRTGEWQGFVGVNEMLAFKLPLSLYTAFMKEAHHDAPASEEQKLADTAEQLRQEAEARGAKLEEGDGLSELRNSRPLRPIFED